MRSMKPTKISNQINLLEIYKLLQVSMSELHVYIHFKVYCHFVQKKK